MSNDHNADECKRFAGERERFEAWYLRDSGFPAEAVQRDASDSYYVNDDCMSAWEGWQARAAQPAPVQHPDDVAVDRFAAAMKAKLAKSRAKGRGGWEDKSLCSAEYLSELLRGHVDKGDPVDVANFCMMLQQRGEGISAPAQQVECQECARLQETAGFWGRACASSVGERDRARTELNNVRAELSEVKSSMSYRTSLVGRLESELAALKAQQVGQKPVGTVHIKHFRGCRELENVELQLTAELPEGSHNIYTAPQPAPDQDVEGWIPVSERLPEVGERVLGSTDTVEEVTYWAHKPGVHDGEAGWCDTHENLVEVTHWMPLPAAPAHDKQSGGEA